MTQDLHKWRHDLRAAINTMQDVAQILTAPEPSDPQLAALYAQALRKASDRLEGLYDQLPELLTSKAP